MEPLPNSAQARGAFAGLSEAEASLRLQRYGANAVQMRQTHPLRSFSAKLWGPVPWMLEATLVLEIFLGKQIEAAIVAALLLVNAALSFRQERQAKIALELLRRRLSIRARVLRDASWRSIPAEELVVDDVVYLRMGDLVPADVELLDGTLSIDQATLTGESLPVDRKRNETIYAASMVVRGEATGRVAATGSSTYFGKTAELVHSGAGASRTDAVVYAVVRYLAAIDTACAAAILADAFALRVPLPELLPFILILLVTAVPVALPAAFAVMTAVAALELSKRGVLVARLQALENAAAMDVLCADKTGTLTQNRLRLSEVVPYAPCDTQRLLALAALASDHATQDPFDCSILERSPRDGIGERIAFVPFDPATKRSEASVRLADGSGVIHVIKGAPATLAALAVTQERMAADVERLAASGMRILAVAFGSDDALRVAGLLAFSDPPRPDAEQLIASLRERGVGVHMVTGDGKETAHSIAAMLGIEQVDAEILPEGKFRLVERLQSEGHVVGMTGDGVNDAPPLRRADVGIAVAEATDIAKASASLVLTTSGLAGLPITIDVGREVHQRMLTWTLNKLVKAQQAALLLTLGFFLTGGAMVMTPRLMLLMLFANDFVTLSLATDRVRGSHTPDRWELGPLMIAAVPLGLAWTAFALGVFFLGEHRFGLDLPQLQTLTFLTLIFTGQATILLVRERGWFWTSLPGRWILIAGGLDIVAVSLLAITGTLMAPIPTLVVLGLFGLVVAVTPLMDLLKRWCLRQSGLKPRMWTT